jgi:hypothetical protein
MNQERFDQLAQALATNSISRRQVLKILAVSGVLGIFSPFGGQHAEAQTSCRANGRGCKRDSQCCSDICARGRCKCKKPGQSCSESRNCCVDSTGGQTCQGGKCCRKPGFGCAANAECCSGNCCDGFCCAPNQTCQNGECVCNDPWEPCDLSCCNPLTQECRNGACCSSEGVRCSRDSQCCSGVCKDGQCDPPPCQSKGGACSHSSDCCDEEYPCYGECCGSVCCAPCEHCYNPDVQLCCLSYQTESGGGPCKERVYDPVTYCCSPGTACRCYGPSQGDICRCEGI